MRDEVRYQAKSLLLQLSEEDRFSLLQDVGTPAYPWFRVVQGDDVEQGDILENCSVFQPSDELIENAPEQATFRWAKRDVIVVSQSCDIVKGREKISDVLLCAVWRRSEFTRGHLATTKGMEDARRGNLPGFHVLASCNISGFEREVRVVEFGRISALPLSYLRKLAEKAGKRFRLLPPYREQLSQALARFFMRVGLPVDIPPFK